MTRQLNRNGSTRKGRAENARILAASTICWICGQDGADGVDHVIPIARGGFDTRANKRPAHHNTPNAQGIRCNRVKGARLHAPIVKRSGVLN